MDMYSFYRSVMISSEHTTCARDHLRNGYLEIAHATVISSVFAHVAFLEYFFRYVLFKADTVCVTMFSTFPRIN